MKTIILFIGLLIVNVTLAQENIDKKEKRANELTKEFQETSSLVEGRRFVLKADYLTNKAGNHIEVLPNLNFILVDSADVVIQVGSTNGLGHNGVGGTTIKGVITKWRLKKNDKNKSLYLQIRVMSNIDNYDIEMHVSPNKSADASLTGTTYGRLDYSGTVKDLENSRIYKGQQSF